MSDHGLTLLPLSRNKFFTYTCVHVYIAHSNLVGEGSECSAGNLEWRRPKLKHAWELTSLCAATDHQQKVAHSELLALPIMVHSWCSLQKLKLPCTLQLQSFLLPLSFTSVHQLWTLWWTLEIPTHCMVSATEWLQSSPCKFSCYHKKNMEYW